MNRGVSAAEGTRVSARPLPPWVEQPPGVTLGKDHGNRIRWCGLNRLVASWSLSCLPGEASAPGIYDRALAGARIDPPTLTDRQALRERCNSQRGYIQIPLLEPTELLRRRPGAARPAAFAPSAYSSLRKSRRQPDTLWPTFQRAPMAHFSVGLDIFIASRSWALALPSWTRFRRGRCRGASVRARGHLAGCACSGRSPARRRV